MFRFLFFPLLLFSLIFSCASNEQQLDTNPDSPNVQEDQIVKNENSLLWRVEGEGIQTSYLFGTMHMINQEYFTFPSFLQEKIKNSESIIMEMDGIPNPIATFQMMSLDSGKIHDYFNAEQLIELLAFMDQEMGISPKEFDLTYGNMKPFFLIQTITQHHFEADAQSYDLMIMALAGEEGIPIVGLETAAEQLGFFDQVSQEVMADLVMESIHSFEKEKESTEKLMKLYAKQKVKKLIPLLNKQSPELMEYADLFLYDRNRSWIPKLMSEMREKKSFIAVGAAHLFGENGIIDLLRQKGLTVTAIQMNPEE